MGNQLARVRRERGWKKSKLLRELRAAAARRQEILVSDASLGRRVAVWENQHGPVGERYRELLCEVYGLSAVELGIAEEPPSTPEPSPAVPELSERITFSRLDAGLVALLRDHTQSIRMLDRRLGGAAIYQQAAAHVDQIGGLVRFAVPGAHREAAADELSQAAALAGWQALDMGRTADAWRLHEIATAAGRESGHVAGFAYARAQQAFVLLDAGQLDDAHGMIRAGLKHAGTHVSPVLRAWLHAAEGEALAALGRRDAALRALDAALDALPAQPHDDALPYVMLDAGHLARWRGHCLARLGDAGAIEDLMSALDAMGEGRYGRAEVGLRVDLALAFRARGDAHESHAHACRAAELASRTGSERQRKRIAALLSA
jgi:tetratricopeptide (TPR) repeat protein